MDPAREPAGEARHDDPGHERDLEDDGEEQPELGRRVVEGEGDELANRSEFALLEGPESVDAREAEDARVGRPVGGSGPDEAHAEEAGHAARGLDEPREPGLVVGLTAGAHPARSARNEKIGKESLQHVQVWP